MKDEEKALRYEALSKFLNYIVDDVRPNKGERPEGMPEAVYDVLGHWMEEVPVRIDIEVVDGPDAPYLGHIKAVYHYADGATFERNIAFNSSDEEDMLVG